MNGDFGGCSNCPFHHTSTWRKRYLRNPNKFIEKYLGVKLTSFQKILIRVFFWQRGKR